LSDADDSCAAELKAIFGENLRVRRAIQRLSQGDVHATSGLSLKLLSRVENGHANPRFDTLAKLARAVGLDLPQMLMRRGSEPGGPG
jgi:transcriptional regulator with XRE-family HTH domain